MFQLSTKGTTLSWKRLAPLSAVIVCLALFGAKPIGAQVVAQYGFEDGTTQGWASFNGASTPVNSATVAHTGTHSLLTTTNSSGSSSGPSIRLNSVLLPGATYQITGFVMLTPGESPVAANFTMLRNDPNCNGGQCFDTIGAFQVSVSASGWAQIGGTYTVSMTETGVLLYAQLEGATMAQSFYLDDVIINEIAPPPGGPQDNSGISTNFEDGGPDGWTPRVSSTLTNTTADSHTGMHSLLATNRSGPFDGPQINVANKMYNGSQYAISVWMKLGPSATQADTIRVSLQVTLGGTTTFHTVIGNTAIPLGTWVNLSITKYNMGFAYDPGQAFLYVESNSGTQDFYIDDFQLTFIPPPQIQTNIPSIFETLSYYFPVGAEIDSTDISGVHAQLLTKHFNSVVSGNDMKWSSVEPVEGNFTFAAADAQVSFAQNNNLLFRGHNLVWANGSQTPSWVFLEPDGTTPLSASNPADVNLLTQRIWNHIMVEVQHFGSAIYVWDVVNEPIDPSQPDCLTHGPFYNVLGKSYIDIALQAARQFAPQGTQLFINDFNTDSNKLSCLVTVIQDLRSRSIPIDGVGHEEHNHINFPQPSGIVNAVNTIATAFPGLHQQVTELDISVYTASDNTSNFGANGGTVPASILAEQGWLYEQFFNGLRQLRGELDAVTFWGFADDDTWLDSFPINRLDMPLPFDTGLQAKPAYWGIVDPTQLPGFGLSFTLSSKTGAENARVWTITATNGGTTGAAFATQITGFALTQVGGAACTPVITPPSSYPVLLGDIANGSSASASFTIDFTGCANIARFTLSMPWRSATYDTGTFTLGNQFR
jgi:endo-1,4-beta-xylanase